MTTYRQDIVCVIHGRSFPKYTQAYLSTEEQFHYVIVQKYSQLPLRTGSNIKQKKQRWFYSREYI